MKGVIDLPAGLAHEAHGLGVTLKDTWSTTLTPWRSNLMHRSLTSSSGSVPEAVGRVAPRRTRGRVEAGLQGFGLLGVGAARVEQELSASRSVSLST